MAKKDDEKQMALIDVDDPKLKAVKKQITEYETLLESNKEEGLANRIAEKNKRNMVFEAVRGSGRKPDAEGFYHLTFGDRVYDIGQDSQLKIKKHKAPKADAPAEADDDDSFGKGGDVVPADEGAEPAASRRSR